jgi:hypothetical protein
MRRHLGAFKGDFEALFFFLTFAWDMEVIIRIYKTDRVKNSVNLVFPQAPKAGVKAASFFFM